MLIGPEVPKKYFLNGTYAGYFTAKAQSLAINKSLKKDFGFWTGFKYNGLKFMTGGDKGMISIGVIGCGHWGPNHIRIFSQLTNSRVLMCADLDQKRLSSVATLFPDIQVTQEYKDILANPAIDAVVVAVPTNFHFKITQEALQAGKHVLCEKPLALRAEECLTLGALAQSLGRVLMVGHIFVFNQGIVKLREYIATERWAACITRIPSAPIWGHSVMT